VKPFKDFYGSLGKSYCRPPFQVAIKEMFKAYHIRHLLKEILPRLLHENDGLIFTPVNKGYVFGTNEQLLKWKPFHTVDFKVRQLHDQCQLLIANRNIYEDSGEQLKEDPTLCMIPDGSIIECAWDRPSSSWTFLRLRTDKPHANDKSVFQKILRSIENDVSKEDLLSMADQIKQNWDLRHPK
jgi:mRNA guanylyltransferase